MEALKRLFYSALLAGSLASASSAVDKDGFDVEGRFAWAPRYNQLALNDSKLVPVHPAETGYISGPGATVKAGNGFEAFVLRPGVELGYNSGNVRPKIGLDVELNLDGTLINAKDGPTMSDFKQQPGDSRPSDQGSFAIDKFNRDPLGVYPFVGVDFRMGEGVLTAEIGMPLYQTGTRSWGHHRFDKFEEIGSETSALKGWRARVAFGGAPNADTPFGASRLGIEFLVEKYAMDFGNLTSFSVGLFTKF